MHQGDGHDLKSELLELLDNYAEGQRWQLEQLNGSEVYAEAVFRAIDDAVAALRAPLRPDVVECMRRFRELSIETDEPALELFAAKAYRALLPHFVRLEERATQIVLMAEVAAPSARASAALANLVRCYCLGLDAEAIAMGRAALDVAVTDVIDAMPVHARREVKLDTMRAKVEWLERLGRLSEQGRCDAMEVWIEGNRILHSSVKNVERAAELVQMALRVIAALFPLSDPA